MITIRNMQLGSGRPKICVPLVSDSLEALDKECASLVNCPLDMLEWRGGGFFSFPPKRGVFPPPGG